ncbi:D-alanine--poly(phosphoribitol) ligase [Agrobacterium vitis]|uniref:AMP-binding protein n=1 Tax=Agrobacterium vitis TaxID=373 RepID=UPI001F18984D|nr:AMP-binding protein [Agrobacterium vitis]MCF1470136.1 D-alanine--poly(phosphoribitol) ligase [Agrobacterium vitis]
MTSARSVIVSIFDAFRDSAGFAYRHIDGDLTYPELYGRASALSARLAAQAPTRSPVIIWGHKHRSYLVAYWACLLSGRPLIPVEPDIPPHRLQRTIDSCGAGLLLQTQGELPDMAGIDVWRIDDVETVTSHGEIPEGADHEIAYIMYSSGSSGMPKGIMISYANLADFILWLRDDLLRDTEFQAVSGNVRHCFDVSLFELWSAWLWQKPISGLDHSEFINSRKYIDRYADHKVGFWVSTPSIVQTYLKDPRFNAVNLPALSTFLFCGEVLGKPVAQALRARFPHARIVNTYGPTECTVAVTAVDIEDQHIVSEKPLPIGYARPGCSLSLEAGQIVISGTAVGPGYIKLPEKQAAGFPAKNSYRTGDTGSRDEAGLWYFHGRLDREVKLLGVRIDLNEIEEEIRKLDAVHAVFIEPLEIAGTMRALRAYVHGPENQNSLCAIAVHIAGVLPPVMVPRFWYLCPELLYNQNTKIDKEKTMAIAHSRKLDYAYSPAA